MKISTLLNISKIISIIFVVFAAFLISLLIYLSFKPIKIDFSEKINQNNLFQEFEIKKVGDSYLTFNKFSKNFEFLFENIETDKIKIPNLLLGVELKNLFLLNFKPSIIKIYDSKIEFNFSESANKEVNWKSFEKNFLKRVTNEVDNSVLEKIFFDFNVVELNNSYVTLIGFSENEINFNQVDFKLKKNKSGYKIDALINQKKNESNIQNASFFLEKKNNVLEGKLNFKNFDIEFSDKFLNHSTLRKINISLSGSKEIKFSENLDILDFNSKINFTSTAFLEKKNILEQYKFSDGIFFSSIQKDKIVSNFDFLETGTNFKLKLILDKKNLILETASLELDKISLKQVKRMWPENVMPETYDWINKRILGLIKNLRFDFDIKDLEIFNILGNFDFEQVSLNFLDNMTNIYDLQGSALIKPDEILFKVNNGESNNIFIENGNIEIIDIKKPIESAVIDLNLSGEIEDIINYVRNSPINITDFDRINRLSGKPDFNLKLKFPLLLDLKVDEMIYESTLSFKDSIFYNLYDKYTLKNADLDIKIDGTGVNYSGQAKFEGLPLKFVGKQYLHKKMEKEQIELDVDLDSNFLENNFDSYLKNCDGDIPLKIFYNANNTEKTFEIKGQANINKFNTDVKFLGINQNYEKGLINFNVISSKENIIEAEVSLKNKNLDFLLAFNKNFENTKLLVKHFRSKDHDFSLSYVKENFKEDILLKGKQINMDSFLDDFFKKDFHQSKINFLKFKFAIETLILNQNKIKNPIFSGEINQDGFEKLNFEIDSTEFNHSVEIKEFNQKKQVDVLSNNASELIKYIKLNPNTKNGELFINGEKSYGNYKGKFLIKDFIAYDTPLLAKILTFFSIDGLEQKLIDGGIFFDFLESDYSFKNFEIKFSDGFGRGSDLGLTFEGEMNLISQDFKINGTLIPAYTLNTLFTSLPIVGDIITAGSPEEGILAATFNVSNINDKINITFNPISVLVPSIIRNLLKDDINVDLKN